MKPETIKKYQRVADACSWIMVISVYLLLIMILVATKKQILVIIGINGICGIISIACFLIIPSPFKEKK